MSRNWVQRFKVQWFRVEKERGQGSDVRDQRVKSIYVQQVLHID
jgi:hypothetical protein